VFQSVRVAKCATKKNGGVCRTAGNFLKIVRSAQIFERTLSETRTIPETAAEVSAVRASSCGFSAESATNSEIESTL
jgi:hypothetical protein